MEDNTQEKEWLAVGNFLLRGEDGDDGRQFVVKSVSGGWRISWRDDTLMYGVLLSLVDNEGSREYLHCLCTLMFVATTYPHDLVALTTKGALPFMEGIAKLVREQSDYEVSLKKPVSEEEDAEALNETVEMESLKEDLKRIYGEDGGME